MNRIAVIFLLVTSLIGCNKDESEANKNFFPLAVGNTWRFESVTDGEVRSFYQKIVAEKDFAFGDKQTLGYFIEYGVDESKPNSKKAILGKDNSGGVLNVGIANNSDELIRPSTFFKYPVLPGDSWKYDHLSFSYQDGNTELKYDGSYEMSCISIDTEVETPYGVFKCIVYKDHFSPYEDEIWERLAFVAPGYGIVKTENWQNGILVNWMVLTDIKI